MAEVRAKVDENLRNKIYRVLRNPAGVFGAGSHALSPGECIVLSGAYYDDLAYPIVEYRMGALFGWIARADIEPLDPLAPPVCTCNIFIGPCTCGAFQREQAARQS